MSKQKQSKTVYISLTLQELAALEAFGFRERWAYIAWKRLANFKTGVAGDFRKQKLTYDELAKHLSPPPGVQGRGQGGMDDTQARDTLLAFERAGLVADIGRRQDNNGLIFTMPMSPVGGKKAAQTTTPPSPPAGQVPQIFPETEPPQTVGEPAPVPLPDPSADSLSVLINKKIHINTEGADLGTAEAAQCRATGAARTLEEIPREAAASAAALDAEGIERVLADDWDFVEVHTPASRARYEQWAKAGVSLTELEAAMGLAQSLDDHGLTPAALEAHLWPKVSGGSSRPSA